MQFTEMSKKALEEGQTQHAFGATVCPSCELLFLDGVEGNAEDERCEDCWDKERDLCGDHLIKIKDCGCQI